MPGTLVLTTEYKLGHVRAMVFTGKGDSSDGSFPTLDIPKIAGRLIALETNPGATAPTDNWDVTAVDEQGLDALQGVGANRDTTNTEKVPVVYSGTALHPVVGGWQTLTLTPTGNSVNDADIVITLFHAPGV